MSVCRFTAVEYKGKVEVMLHKVRRFEQQVDVRGRHTFERRGCGENPCCVLETCVSARSRLQPRTIQMKDFGFR